MTNTPMFEDFGPAHLSWLVYRDLVAYPTTLGMISGVEPEGMTNEIKQQLVQWGVITVGEELTKEAQELFRGLHSFDHAFWGALLLHNEREPFLIEMDQELIDLGLGDSIPDTPRVYWQVSYEKDVITVAMRAGDHITIHRAKTTKEHLFEGLAAAIFSVLDPHGVWPAANFSTVKVPYAAVERAPVRGSNGALLGARESARAVRSELLRWGVERDVATRFSKLAEAEKLASTEVLCVSRGGVARDGFFIIEFVYQVGMVLSRLGVDFEGEQLIVQEGATIRSVAGELRKMCR